jgi:GPH family glycoside/pentoside/hexuronide:cation symporter
LFYGIGEMPITISMPVFGLFVLFFYNSVMGLSALWAGSGIAAGLVLDAMIDPYIGFRSDRSRHRLGRRHSFMLAGAVAMGPLLYLIFSPPRGLRGFALFLWLLSFSVLFRAASALYRIPYLGMGAELTSDYVERTQVICIRSLFGLLGMLSAAAASFLIFFKSGASDAKLNYANYPLFGLFYGACLSLTGLVCVFGTWSRRHQAAPSAAANSPSVRAFFQSFWRGMSNPAFRSIWLFTVLFFLAVVVNSALSIQFFTWLALISDSSRISAIQAGFYVGALTGVVVWLWQARRGIEKRTLCIAGTLGTATLLVCASLLFGQGRPLGTGNHVALILGHALAGLFASTVWIVPSSMVADVSDLDELSLGSRQEGVFFGIINFGEKVASGAGLLFAGALLNYVVRLAPAATVQDPVTVSRLGLAYGLVPAALLASACLLIASYRLNRAAVADIQSKIAARRIVQP